MDHLMRHALHNAGLSTIIEEWLPRNVRPRSLENLMPAGRRVFLPHLYQETAVDYYRLRLQVDSEWPLQQPLCLVERVSPVFVHHPHPTEEKVHHGVEAIPLRARSLLKQREEAVLAFMGRSVSLPVLFNNRRVLDEL